MPMETSETEPIVVDLGALSGAEIEPTSSPDRVPNPPKMILDFERRRGTSHESHREGYGRPDRVRDPQVGTPGRG